MGKAVSLCLSSPGFINSLHHLPSLTCCPGPSWDSLSRRHNAWLLTTWTDIALLTFPSSPAPAPPSLPLLLAVASALDFAKIPRKSWIRSHTVMVYGGCKTWGNLAILGPILLLFSVINSSSANRISLLE